MMNDLLQKYGKSDIVPEIYFDRDYKLILATTQDYGKSASQISLECNIAQSTAYRKLKRLTQLNLVGIKNVMGRYGRWEKIYHSNLCLLSNPSLFSEPNT